MINKTEFAQEIVDKYCQDNSIKQEEIQDTACLQSSTLAVCMEFLDLIKDEEMKVYASTRDGTVIITKKGGHLSTRELIELLPDVK